MKHVIINLRWGIVTVSSMKGKYQGEGKQEEEAEELHEGELHEVRGGSRGGTTTRGGLHEGELKGKGELLHGGGHERKRRKHRA